MPASSVWLRFVPPLLFLGHLLSIGAFVWCSTFAFVNSPAALALYESISGPGSFGHRFANRLWAAATAREPVAMIVGMSTAREGFDAQLLTLRSRACRFVNAGTSVGPMSLFELDLALVQQYDVRPARLILALHPLCLGDRDLDLEAAAYTDLMDLSHGWPVVRTEAEARYDAELAEVERNSLWPGNRMARQLSRLCRRAALLLNHSFGGRRQRDEFEIAPRDLEPQPVFSYPETRHIPGQERVTLEWLRAKTTDWGSDEQVDCLRRCLDLSERLSPDVVIVIMPEHSLVRRQITAPLRERMLSVLGEHRGRLRVLDYGQLVPDDQFRDGLHLVEAGRERLSLTLARDLEAAR